MVNFDQLALYFRREHVKKVAVIVPAYNEELTIQAVILDFWSFAKKQNFDYKLYVIDNNSKDNTHRIAQETLHAYQITGEVIFVKRQGKANAVREAFRKIYADVYILVDADCTYWAEDLEKFITPILDNDIDMVIGDRISTGFYAENNKRAFHNFGNALVKNSVNYIFNSALEDIMTGYRGFSRRFVKNYPILCEGFELETDMSIFCLENKFNMLEVPIKFTDRPEGSFSKLNTYFDGLKVILTVFSLFRNYKPMHFFGFIGFALFVFSLIAGAFPVENFIKTHYVQQVPMAILSVGLMITSMLSFSIGLILSSVRRMQRMIFETNMLHQETRHD